MQKFMHAQYMIVRKIIPVRSTMYVASSTHAPASGARVSVYRGHDTRDVGQSRLPTITSLGQDNAKTGLVGHINDVRL